MSNYRIGTVPRNWTIEERHVHGDNSKTPGRVEWKPKYYFGSRLDHCAKKLLDLRARENYEGVGPGCGRVIECYERARGSVEQHLNRLAIQGPD